MRHATRRSTCLVIGLVACLVGGCDSASSSPESESSGSRIRQTITNKVTSVTLLDEGGLLKVNVRTGLAQTLDGATDCEVAKALIIPLDAVDAVERLEDELLVKLARIARSGPYRTTLGIVDGECIDVTTETSTRGYAVGVGIDVTQAK